MPWGLVTGRLSDPLLVSCFLEFSVFCTADLHWKLQLPFLFFKNCPLHCIQSCIFFFFFAPTVCGNCSAGNWTSIKSLLTVGDYLKQCFKRVFNTAEIGWSQFVAHAGSTVRMWSLGLLPDAWVGQTPPRNFGVWCWIPHLPQRHFCLWMYAKLSSLFYTFPFKFAGKPRCSLADLCAHIRILSGMASSHYFSCCLPLFIWHLL